MSDFLFFENKLHALFDGIRDCSPLLKESMEYAVFGGGKRIRPRLMKTVCTFLGVDFETVLPFALSLELIHSYSLVHDDLPCMDNDEFRRGKETVHKKFGESMALLCGDALLNMAYENILNNLSGDTREIDAGRFLARQAGLFGMVGGQTMEFDGTVIGKDNLLTLDGKKTGALFVAACRIPCFFSEDREKVKVACAYGERIGEAFQISDDILDGDKEEKTSFVTVFGREEGEKRLLWLYEQTERDLKSFKKSGEELLTFFHKASFRTL